MKRKSSPAPRQPRFVTRPWWTAPMAFMVTLLALPVSAGITIPDQPLTTG